MIKMVRMIIFDLDSTLAPIGLGMGEEELKDVKVFRHVDSFDIVPAQIDKAVGISYLLKIMDISPKDIIAVGDGVNDYAMFALAGFAIGVNVKEDFRVDKN